MVDHTAEMVNRERRIKQSLTAFALLVVLLAIVWLAFYRYL